MPTTSTYKIPRPKSWDEFEDITLSALRMLWETSSLQRNGRQGQNQDGVDIYGLNDLQEDIGIQCKHVESLTENDIKNEIRKAEKFEPTLRVLYFATSLSRDAKLQTLIRKMSKERVKNDNFPIGIFFWEDLMNELGKNKEEFNRHYPDYNIENRKEDLYGKPRKLAIIDLAYYGQSIKYYIDLLFGEFGQFTEDPLQFPMICSIIEKSAIVLMNQESVNLFSSKINELVNYIIPWVTQGEHRPQGWKPAYDIATGIETLCSQIVYDLSADELKYYVVSEKLGIWNMKLEKTDLRLSRKEQREIIRMIKKLINYTVIRKDIMNILNKYNTENVLYTLDTAFRIYKILRTEIMMHGK